MPADGGIGVVAQALDIGDGDQEQIQSPGAVVAAAQVMVANQPVVHPAKAWGDLPLPIRSEQMFADHKQDTVFGCVALGDVSPRMFWPCSTTRRAMGAMSSCNVRPVIIAISPIKPGSLRRQKSCNVPRGLRGTLQDDCTGLTCLWWNNLSAIQTRGSSSSSSPDGPGATAAHAWRSPDPGSSRGWLVCETSAAGWPVCWRGGRRVCRSNAGGRWLR